MLKLSLPFWLGGVELAKLRAAAQSWWERVESWLRWPLLQLDPETCHIAVLELLAWQRDISRYHDEPDSAFRLRVKFAFSNAVDAGSSVGIERVFMRLGVGEVVVTERFDPVDWDVIRLAFSDEQSSEHSMLIRVVIDQYGRTCRRYEISADVEVVADIYLFDFSDDQQTFSASLEQSDGIILRDDVYILR